MFIEGIRADGKRVEAQARVGQMLEDVGWCQLLTYLNVRALLDLKGIAIPTIDERLSKRTDKWGSGSIERRRSGIQVLLLYAQHTCLQRGMNTAVSGCPATCQIGACKMVRLSTFALFVNQKMRVALIASADF